MLTLVEVTNARGDNLELPLLDASAGYSVREITGLDPVNAALTSSTIAQQDGAQFQNARRDSRNITMKLGLEPDYVESTVQSLRQGLFPYLLPKTNVTLGFYLDDVLYVTASGQVESFENAMFSADPEVDISILCYDPDFYATEATAFGSSTVSNTNTETISYEGTTEIGIIFEMTLDRDLDSFAIYNTTPDNVVQQFLVTGELLDGDILTMTSIAGIRGFTITRDMIPFSAMFYVDPAANWITLENGDNDLRVFAAGAAISYTVTYTPKYGAI
jgi:Siphovirus-type tail component, C-terminal domain